MKKLSYKLTVHWVLIFLFVSKLAFSQGSNNSVSEKKCKCECTRDESLKCPNENCCERKYLLYDFRCKTFFFVKDNKAKKINRLSNLKIKYGQELRFKVSNINRYLYQVDFAANDVHYKSDPPALFQRIFLGTGIADSVATANLFAGAKNKSAKNIETEHFLDLFSTLMTSRNKLLNAKLKAYSYCAKIEDCNCGSMDFTDLSNQLTMISDAYVKAKVELSGDTSNQAKELMKNIDLLWTKVAQIKDKDLLDLVLFNNNMVANHLRFEAPPIFPQGNRLQLGFRIHPTDTASKLNVMPLYDDSTSLDLPVLYKPFVSFSSGLFYTWGDHFKSDEYSFIQKPTNNHITDTSSYIVAKSGTSQNRIGFSAMANLGFKFRPNLGAALSLGVGVTVENKPRPAYLLGLSLLVGDLKQFNFTAGMVALPIDVLKSELYPNIGVTQYSSAGQISYDRKLMVDWVVSLSYTFFTLETQTRSKSGRR